MAFPIVEATNTSEETVATTSHDVALPASIQAGEFLLAVLTTNEITPPDGWTEITEASNLAVEMRFPATGSEGASAAFASGVSVATGHNAYRISGAHGDVAFAGSLSDSDPPNLAPAWGNTDNLWIAGVIAINGSGADVDVTAAPDGYGGLIKSAQVANGSDRIRVATAWRQSAAGSENPGPFTLSGATSASRTFTLAVRPASAETTLTASLFVNGNTFPDQRVDLWLSAALYADPDAFYATIVDDFTIELSPGIYVDADVFYAASLTAERPLVEVPAPGSATLNDVSVPTSATLNAVSAPLGATLNPVSNPSGATLTDAPAPTPATLVPA